MLYAKSIIMTLHGVFTPSSINDRFPCVELFSQKIIGFSQKVITNIRIMLYICARIFMRDIKSKQIEQNSTYLYLLNLKN
jgi:hypothetical protein